MRAQCSIRMRRINLARTRTPLLPYDLIHSNIIPDILSNHLHLLLDAPIAPDWHAFHTLPLVSFAFSQTCRSLFVAIFGLNINEDGSAIKDILAFAQSLWNQAKHPHENSERVFEYTYAQIMSSNSLIRIYICIALSRSFLNADVLKYMIHSVQFGGQGTGSIYGNDGRATPLLTRVKMPDEKMHRLYLPLTCALELCDTVRPERLTHIVAEYLANIVPLFAAAPVILKYSQDLQSYVDQEHRVETIWIRWTRQTLGLVADAGVLIQQIQETSRLIQSFQRSSSVPREVLQGTGIIAVLNEVIRADWGIYSEEIRGRACDILKF
ncbi:hypothetical protein K439DRAFT_1662269 [Ramaria rubella]|nr:hypothetical protein K439DRAFT_1662269 [Ramaria rubella]